MAAATFALAASLLTRTASAVDCVTSQGKPTFTTCRVARGESLRLFYADAQGARYETFERCRSRSRANGENSCSR